ncbi:MAG TPA: hypothetical protein VMZ28_24060 [Kofleriaceae bacterium]|nr:hypothetical protein [Kofleriaceae bacterium]
MRAIWLLGASLAGALAGCDGGGEDEEAANDHLPPTVEVLTPERGTVTPDGTVQVTGRATDAESSVATVTVNGQPAPLAGDGTFEVTLDLGDGITLLETVATDRGGNTAMDARAVLAGTLVAQGTPISEAIAAFVSSQAMTGLSDLINGYASAVDLEALAKSNNPVVDTGDSCNDYKAYVDSVTRGPIEVSAGAADGGIAGMVTIRDLVVEGHIDWEALCANGTTDFVVTADAYDAGALIVPSLAGGGGVDIGLAGVTSTFRGFSVDADGVPGFVEDAFEDDIRDKVAGMLRGKIEEIVPPQASMFLSGFVADVHAMTVLGQTVNMSVWPSDMAWTAAGGMVVFDTETSVVGVRDALVLSTPTARPSEADMAGSGLRLAVADDLLNHLLAGLWASGAMEEALLPADGDALSAAFGADVASATLTMMLPPVTNFDTTTGTAQMALGDVVVEALAQDGSTLAKFVVSAYVDLAVETSSDGGVKITTQTPRVLAQVLEQSDSLLTPLDVPRVEAIAGLAIKQLGAKADSLLENLPVPGLPGATIMSPTFQPVSGYLMMGGDLLYE